jgi:hypothetical protein
MRRVVTAIFVIICLFWTGMVLMSKFPPSEEDIQLRYLAWSKAIHITVPLSFAREMPFPLPVLLLSVVPRPILMSPNYFRIPNLIVGILTLGVLLWLLYKTEPKLTAATLAIATITPWLVWIMMSDFAAILTLFMALVTFSVKDNKWLTFLLITLTSLCSVSGIVFGLVFGIWYALKAKNKKEKLTTAMIVLLITGGFGYHWWSNIAGQSFVNTNGITSASISEQVDQRVRYEFKLNNYQNIIPLAIKRIAYNKIYFSYRVLVSQVFNVFNLEKLAFPAEADATVTRSMWNSKGLPWLLFWEIILIFWGVYYLKDLDPKLKSLCLVFLVWSFAAMYFCGNNFLQNGVGIVIPVAIISALALVNMQKLILYIGGLIIVVGLLTTYSYFLGNELYWRDNRPQVELVMAQMAVTHKADFVTTILGRSFLYYAWLNQMPPGELWRDTDNGNIFRNVRFDHFELKDKSIPAGFIYVGFPGEFLGDKILDNKNDFSPNDLPKNYQLLDAYRPHDTVSFGNGDEIWTVKVN